MAGHDDEGDLYNGRIPPVFSANPQNSDEDNAYKRVIEHVGEDKIYKLTNNDRNFYTEDNYVKIRKAFKDRHFGKVCAVFGIIVVAIIFLLCQIYVPFGNIITIVLTSTLIGGCVIGLIGFYSYRHHILSTYENIRGEKYKKQ